MSTETQSRLGPPAAENRLAASLAHEIHNPLDSVLNLLYLVKAEATLTEQGRGYLTLAEQEIQRIAQIAQAVLDRGRECGVPQDADVPELMNSVIALYKLRFEARGISVSTRYRPDGYIPVYATPLRQVLSNLLLNAADALPAGGRIQARASESHEWSGQLRHGLRVTIADNGSGISAENLRGIFEPFFTTKGSGGSGLGLSLVKDVVQQHGGTLHVRSSTKPGHSGSVFTMFLPEAA